MTTNVNHKQPDNGHVFEQLASADSDGIILHKKIRILDTNDVLCRMFGYTPAEIAELTVLDLMVPEARSTVLRNTLIKYDKPYEAVGLKKDGSTFPLRISSHTITYQDHSVRAMVIRELDGHKDAGQVLDELLKTKQLLEQRLNESTTQLRYANERLRLELDERAQLEEELRRRALQQAAVAELGQRALAGADLPHLMHEAVSTAAQILQVEFAEILELVPERNKFLLQAGVGWPRELIGCISLDVNDNSPAGHALRTNRPVVIEDLRTETRFKQPAMFHEYYLASGVNVVIQGGEHPFGVLGLYTTKRRQFSEDDTHFLQAIANVLSMAIERCRRDDALKSSLQEKEALLHEIHHRVKNNLQMISSLLSLQAGYIKDPQAVEICKDSQNRVRSIALVHEKLYQSGNLARIDFGDYIYALAAPLFRQHGAVARGINLTTTAGKVLLNMESAVPCGLILNELVSNALEHAFLDGQEGEVRIELQAGPDGQVSLVVADNGIGLPRDLDTHNAKTLGLQLVNNLVDQLDGTVEFRRAEGAEVRVSFSLS